MILIVLVVLFSYNTTCSSRHDSHSIRAVWLSVLRGLPYHSYFDFLYLNVKPPFVYRGGFELQYFFIVA